MRKGRVGYIPGVVDEELSRIRKEDGIFSKSEAFKRLVGYTKVGRVAKKKGKSANLDMFDGVL